jgi:hypothetical protein
MVMRGKMPVRARAIGLAFAAIAGLGTSLTGCGTKGEETASLINSPIPPGKARLTLTRPSTILYAGVPATITLNGTKVSELASGGITLIDVPAGNNVLAASAWSYPGAFSVKLAAKAGERYALEIAPRTASFAPGALLGPVGGIIDASVNENAGAFQLQLVAADKKGA